jgi:hypothetical protein
MNRLRASLLLALALGLPAAGPAIGAEATATAQSGAARWDVDQLMATLAQRKTGQAHFTETKYLAALTRPVESSGELLFTAPDRLEKRTLLPTPETMVIQADMLTVERGGKRYTMPLANYPELAAFIESLRGTLAGDRTVLERYYRLSMSGRASRWTLTLAPVDSRMAAIVREVRIEGSHASLDRVEIRQADGDRSVMTIRATAP